MRQKCHLWGQAKMQQRSHLWRQTKMQKRWRKRACPKSEKERK